MNPKIENMKSLVAKILKGIPNGVVFDSHFVIRQAIEQGSDVYLRFASLYVDAKKTTDTTHQKIGQMIQRCKMLVELVDRNSWSENIHASPSRCALWRKK